MSIRRSQWGYELKVYLIPFLKAARELERDAYILESKTFASVKRRFSLVGSNVRVIFVNFCYTRNNETFSRVLLLLVPILFNCFGPPFVKMLKS